MLISVTIEFPQRRYRSQFAMFILWSPAELRHLNVSLALNVAQQFVQLLYDVGPPFMEFGKPYLMLKRSYVKRILEAFNLSVSAGLQLHLKRFCVLR
jgi:hypothetical protein